MPKYVLLFPMSHGDYEAEIYEGSSIDDAVVGATFERRHFNYGRQGVEIYEISDKPIFKELLDE